MTLTIQSNQFQFTCACGWQSQPRYTLEAAGREADLHMAERFPKGSERRPCMPGDEFWKHLKTQYESAL